MIDPLTTGPRRTATRSRCFSKRPGFPTRFFPINIGKGDQFKPEFLAGRANNRIPALVEHEPKGGGKPISIFRIGCDAVVSGGEDRKIPAARPLRPATTRFNGTFWQMGGLGPMAGQNHHFNNYAPEKIKYAIDRYVNETNRLYGVLNKRLADRAFHRRDYSIADMACYPWIVPYKNQSQNIDDFPHLKRWLERSASAPPRCAPTRSPGRQSEFRPAGDSYRGRAQAVVRANRGGGEVACHSTLRTGRQPTPKRPFSPFCWRTADGAGA